MFKNLKITSFSCILTHMEDPLQVGMNSEFYHPYTASLASSLEYKCSQPSIFSPSASSIE